MLNFSKNNLQIRQKFGKKNWRKGFFKAIFYENPIFTVNLIDLDFQYPGFQITGFPIPGNISQTVTFKNPYLQWLSGTGWMEVCLCKNDAKVEYYIKNLPLRVDLLELNCSKPNRPDNTETWRRLRLRHPSNHSGRLFWGILAPPGSSLKNGITI